MARKLMRMAMAFMVAVLAAQAIYAIPAFARKYQMSCKTCHAPFPRLKEYGNEFAGNGFMLKDKDAPRYTTDTGDTNLSLLREIPVAVRLEGYMAYNPGHEKKTDVQAPYLIKLLSGGSLGRGVAYYFYFFFSERGEVAGLEDAFLYFSDLLRTGIGLTIGQFQVCDPLFKRELRLPFEDYRIYATKVGQSSIDLTYDRGLMLQYDPMKSTSLVLAMVNGSGLEPADPLGAFDGDKYKNLFAVVNQDISKWLQLGVSGYVGKERKRGIDNSVWMAGVHATLSLREWELKLQYLERRDDNPDFLVEFAPGISHKVATRGGFAELLYTPRGDDGRWYAAALANWVYSGLDEHKYISGALHWGYLLRRNMRIVLEYTQVFKSAEGRYPRFGIGLVTAF